MCGFGLQSGQRGDQTLQLGFDAVVTLLAHCQTAGKMHLGVASGRIVLTDQSHSPNVDPVTRLSLLSTVEHFLVPAAA